MTEPTEVWRQVADRWTEVYAQIGDDQWDNQTPCSDWTVRELVDHLRWHGTALGLLGAATGPQDGWEEIRSALEGLLADPSKLDGTVQEFGGMPKPGLAAFLIGDRLIHTWDLARSIDVDDTLPADAVAATMAGLEHAPREFLRSPSPLGIPMMGQPIEVPEDASDQDKMLAFTGRRP